MAKIRCSGLNYPLDCASLRDEIRELLSTVKDEGTECDQGGGLGQADLWVWVQGVEYLITVKQSGVRS